MRWCSRGWCTRCGQWAVTGDLTAVEGVIPESLRQLIAQQCDMLSPVAQRMLEAASVAGMASAVAAIVAAVETTDEAIETECTCLAQRGQRCRRTGGRNGPMARDGAVWLSAYAISAGAIRARAGGTAAAAAPPDWSPPGGGLRAQAGTRAAELAMHFDRGRDTSRAVTYLQQAAANALRRWAYAEAIGHLRRGLALLPTLPDTRERRQQELAFHLTLGQACIATQGLAATDVGETYTRAQALCQQVGICRSTLTSCRDCAGFISHAGSSSEPRH